MQLNRLLAYLVIGAFLLTPVLLSWWEISGHVWYRPFIIWFFLILVAAWAARRRAFHDI